MSAYSLIQDITKKSSDETGYEIGQFLSENIFLILGLVIGIVVAVIMRKNLKAKP